MGVFLFASCVRWQAWQLAGLKPQKSPVNDAPSEPDAVHLRHLSASHQTSCETECSLLYIITKIVLDTQALPCNTAIINSGAHTMTDRYDIWKCNSCKAEHIDERDLRSDCVFAGSLEEPAEYIDRCPDCGSDDVEEMPWCECGDVRVFDDGDLCESCYLESIAHLEERHIEERGLTND